MALKSFSSGSNGAIQAGEDAGDREQQHDDQAGGAERFAPAEIERSAEQRVAARQLVGIVGGGTGDRGGDGHRSLTNTGCAGRARRTARRPRGWSTDEHQHHQHDQRLGQHVVLVLHRLHQQPADCRSG
jgi:hypothetical protein